MDSSGTSNDSNNEEKTQEVQLLVPQNALARSANDLNRLQVQYDEYRPLARSVCAKPEVTTLSRRPSAIVSALQQERRPSGTPNIFFDLLHGRILSSSKHSVRGDSVDEDGFVHLKVDHEYEARMRNRRLGDNALTSALSAFYAKLMVVLGIAFPVTDILAIKAPNAFYQGFYLYLYIGSVSFVAFMYADHVRTRRMHALSCTNAEKDKRNSVEANQAKARLGSFYLRVGAVAFGIGSMVYSGLEFGQYFELKGDSSCQNALIALTPAARMILSIVQMQFIFLNTKEFEMKKHKVIVRFGLMHMVATNLCEWLYVLVEETKHEIVHLTDADRKQNRETLLWPDI